MAILEITSRQFRDKQKSIFDLADKGERVVIRRGRKQSYFLMPLDDGDLMLSPEVVEKIDRGIKAIHAEQTKRYTLDELRERMGI